MLHAQPRHVYSLHDGLGLREMADDPSLGVVEMLHLRPELGDPQAMERAIRARAARQTGGCDALQTLHRIETTPSGLRLVSSAPDGIRLSQLLSNVESGVDDLTEAEFIALAMTVMAAVATVHELPSGAAHGAISPGHVVLTPGGGCVLTDGVFGGVFELLAGNRGRLWSEFGIALPAAASVHRFDRRTDLTQLGMVVLALALRRPIRADEYPGDVADLVTEATPDSAGAHGPALRAWLQQALQLPPHTLFASAAAAKQALAGVVAVSGAPRSGREPRPFSFPHRPVTMTAARCGTSR